MNKLISIIILIALIISSFAACGNSKFVPTAVSTNIDFASSNYKHINNGGKESSDGLPYNIDAITGATLTVEGPAVVTSIPLSVREVENLSTGLARGVYQDSEGIFNYEGLDVYHLLSEMKEGDNGIILTDTAYKVVFKNSNREDIATLTIAEIEAAHKAGRPIILAYGIGSKDGKEVAPFVFDGAEEQLHSLGYSEKLKNDDGCIKLVYDNESYGDGSYNTFVNVAYVYLCEETTPGFKHTGKSEDSFGSSRYLDYILTFRGSAIGREYDFTLRDLESLVAYNEDGSIKEGGIGYTDWYSLANNAYWYVNQYEGLKLYELLQYLGMQNAEDMGLKAARTTLVSFVASDGVPASESFSVDTLSYPEGFGFYKKNAQDNGDGKYVPTNADLVKLGYPILLSYGVNNYPYTISKNDDAYVSGLSNAGGPLRVVFGKTQYNHANGSNQVQLVSEVIAGKNKLYNTHYGSDNEDLNALANNTVKISVKDEKGKLLINKNFSVEDIERIVYGEDGNTKPVRDARVKQICNTFGDRNIYEGLSLKYLLMNVLGIPGMNGTVTFVGDNEATITIDELFSNSEGNGMPSILAYANNGSPLVTAKGDAGYEEDVKLNPYLPTDPDTYKVDNQGGPLMMIKPDVNLSQVVTNVKEIRVELIPDSYAHLNGADAKYQKDTVKFYGPGLEKERVFTVAELEGMQITAKTQDYSMLNKAGTSSEARYRGIGVYDLFKLIGINNNAGDVTVECSDGSSYTYSLMQLKKSYPNFLAPEKESVFAMLAYGEGIISDDKMHGQPLTSETGGPLMLVVPQDAADSVNKNLCLKNVKSVYVSANEITTWGHAMSDVFSEFLDYKFDVTFKNDKSEVSKTYTVAELEEMLDIIVRDTYTVLDMGECEGIDLWKLIKRTAGDTIDISNPVSIIAYAEDGYKNDLLSNCGLGGFVDGIEGNNGMLKIILSYAVKGYPLVDKENHEGYTGLTKNCDGPLRIVVEAFQGGSIKYCNKVVVTLPGSDELVLK